MPIYPMSQPKADSYFGQYLTDAEVSSRVHISVQSLRRWRRLGTGPRWIRLGNSVRYPVDELTAWLVSAPSGGGIHKSGTAHTDVRPEGGRA